MLSAFESRLDKRGFQELIYETQQDRDAIKAPKYSAILAEVKTCHATEKRSDNQTDT